MLVTLGTKRVKKCGQLHFVRQCSTCSMEEKKHQAIYHGIQNNYWSHGKLLGVFFCQLLNNITVKQATNVHQLTFAQ